MEGRIRLSWDIQKLFRRHARDITNSLRRRGLNEETAADITQDTFVRVLASPPKINVQIHNPAAYLFRVARNLRIDYERRERLFSRVDLADVDFAAIVDPTPTSETIIYDRQKLALADAALAELPDRTRLAFELHRKDGMTIAEVAKCLELSVSRTWALIHDAYAHIDRRLTGI